MDNLTQSGDKLEDYAIHESQNSYSDVLTPENWVLRGDNAICWSDSALTTNT
jgi:hypothetical protein